MPTTNVSINNQSILCNNGSYSWSKTVEGETIHADGISVSPTAMEYRESLIVDDEKIINVDTFYDMNNVKYIEYKEEYTTKKFNELDFNSQTKTIDITKLEKGNYIITFTIYNNKDYSDYAFKVEIKK